ncbi:MAG: AsmA family protein [Candidatus Omnitrophota bacterium]|nr:AsmA family protein [Candidatus Omnitrophota bacterium]
MKKTFKTIIISLFFLLVIVGIGVFIFLKTFNFNRFKPQIIAASQNALGRSVDFAKIDLKLSLKSGIQLRLTDITVGEHPDFGKDNFLTAKEINLGVSVKELILKRQIRVLGVECKSPHITIIRLKDGHINVQAFGAAAQDKQQAIESHRQKPQSESVQLAATGLPAIFVNRINIDNARLAYIDYSFGPKLSLIFDRITLKAENFSLTEPFPITLRASFASDSWNIFAEGKGQVNMNRLSFLLKDVKATADLSTLSMDALRRLIPQLEGVPLPEVKSGELSASVDLFEAGPQGLIALKSQGILTKGTLRMKELVAPIDSIEAKFTMSESVITLNSMSFSLGKGRAELSGNINDYLFGQNYSLKAKASGINLVKCIDQSAFPVKVKGLVFGEFELNGQGFDPHTILSKLSGNGSVEIKEGQLTDINVLKMVLDKLSFVPNLGAVLEAGLPERFKETIRRKDTVVTAFKAGIGISNGSVQIQSLNMAADGFLFQGSGAVGFDQSYAFDGLFIIPQDLSSRMVGAVPEMEFLLDEAKQIRFPLKVSGKGASVSFMPDVKQIGITAIKHKGRQELEKILDKVFDRSSKDGSQQPSADSEPAKDDSPGSTEEKKKSGKQQLIEGVLDTIFK